MSLLFPRNKKYSESGGIVTNVVLILTILAVGTIIVLQAADLMKLINT